MNQDNQNWLKKSYDFINANLSLIVLVPTVLGSIWQIVQISRLNISYLRFFSPSQVVVDGVLILSLIFITYLLFELIRQMYRRTNVNIPIRHSIIEEIKNSQFDLFLSLSLYLLLFVVLFTSVEFFYPLLKRIFISKPVDTILLFLGISTFLYILVRENIINLALYFIERKVISHRWLEEKLVPNLTLRTEKILSLRVILFFILLIPILKFLSIPIMFISDEIGTPFNTLNMDYVNATVEKDLETNLFRVRYFNDNYLFVEICENKVCDHMIDNKYLPPKYVIYKTEELLFKELDVK